MNKKDYKEIVAFVGERFDKVISLISNMRIEIDYLKENMATKADFREILAAMDAYAHQTENYFQEHKMLGGQVRRHESWIEKIAKKTDVKLDY